MWTRIQCHWLGHVTGLVNTPIVGLSVDKPICLPVIFRLQPDPRFATKLFSSVYHLCILGVAAEGCQLPSPAFTSICGGGPIHGFLTSHVNWWTRAGNRQNGHQHHQQRHDLHWFCQYSDHQRCVARQTVRQRTKEWLDTVFCKKQFLKCQLWHHVPPLQLNNAAGDHKRRWHCIVIALGGPLTQFQGFAYCSKHVQVAVRILNTRWFRANGYECEPQSSTANNQKWSFFANGLLQNGNVVHFSWNLRIGGNKSLSNSQTNDVTRT